jgi:hypothetical protein
MVRGSWSRVQRGKDYESHQLVVVARARQIDNWHLEAVGVKGFWAQSVTCRVEAIGYTGLGFRV